jgi:hypothetical protein
MASGIPAERIPRGVAKAVSSGPARSDFWRQFHSHAVDFREEDVYPRLAREARRDGTLLVG